MLAERIPGISAVSKRKPFRSVVRLYCIGKLYLLYPRGLYTPTTSQHLNGLSMVDEVPTSCHQHKKTHSHPSGGASYYYRRFKLANQWNGGKTIAHLGMS